MGVTLGTDARSNVSVNFQFLYGTEGTLVSWPHQYKINNLSNSGESVDGNYRISDLDIYFIDPYGSMFQNRFGNGTVGLGSSFQVISHVGGTFEYQQRGLNNIFLNQGYAGGHAATIHTGNIYSISYQDKLLRLRSKSRMANLASLKWQFPVYSFGALFTIYGSFAFQSGNIATGIYGPHSFYEVEENNSKWKANAYVLGTNYGPNGYLHVGGYPPMSGRGTGTLPLYGDDTYFYYAGTNSGGTNFYDEHTPIKLTGTFFGTLDGTINTDIDARYYGYANQNEADAAKSGTQYIINKSRVKAASDFTGSYFHFIAPIGIAGNPKVVFQDMIYGGMVSPIFTSTDIDSNSLNISGTNMPYFNLNRRVWFDEENVIDSLKDLFNTTQAVFYVDTSDKFVFRTYGPQNLNQSITAFGTNDIISSRFQNLEEDYFNRFIFKYAYDSEGQQFGSLYEEKGAGWNRNIDRPLEINSLCVTNPNEAVTLTQRLKAKYARTFPHIDFVTNISKVGYDIGTLLQITDPNSGLSSKTVQIVGYSKNWSNKTIEFQCLDAETLYQRRGYAQWEGDASLTNIVSGTSTSGWGVGGTVNNINSTIYGSQFVWW
jgi:hypothetical protein